MQHPDRSKAQTQHHQRQDGYWPMRRRAEQLPALNTTAYAFYHKCFHQLDHQAENQLYSNFSAITLPEELMVSITALKRIETPDYSRFVPPDRGKSPFLPSFGTWPAVQKYGKMNLLCLKAKTVSAHEEAGGGKSRPQSMQQAFTLTEVLVAVLVFGISLGGILGVYVQCATRTDWSSTSVAAQLMAQSGLERCRAAKYDPAGNPPTDNLVSSNFPTQVYVLDQATGPGVSIYGTNITTIALLSANPPFKLVRVDCTWCSRRGVLYTNTALTYRAPDQ